MKIIHNSKFIIQNSSKGYTLIELLAVTSIIVVVAGLIVGILWSTFTGSSKIRVTNNVAQGANYALSVISNTAQNAVDVTEVGGSSVPDCTQAPSGPSIEFEQANGNRIIYLCDAAEQSIASSSGGMTHYLIDNQSLRVNPATCSFSCIQPNQNPYSQPIITVSFSVSQRGQNESFENVSSSNTSVSVTMRNYSP